MGNTTGREKGRHFSGEDAGPTMRPPRDEEDMFMGEMDESGEFAPGTFKRLSGDEFEPVSRLRASTITSGMELSERKLPTVFKWEGGGKSVHIAGSFDNWKSKIPMVKSHGDFFTIIDLPEGQHQYKFLVDGTWQCDPNETTIDNDLGSQNNSVHVKSSDFEVFEALAMDSVSAGQKAVSGSPPGDYSQHIPSRNSGSGFHHGGPPILPPHLLQVILNKEIPLHDGVMVLSATHRYRKKYVTTLLYKPI